MWYDVAAAHHRKEDHMNQVALDLDSIVPVIKKTSLFRHLPDADLERVLGLFTAFEYGPGETILTQGTVSDELYVVIDQSVAVEVDQGDRNVYITTLGPGEMFGEAGIFLNVARTANVVAHDGALLIRIDRATFLGEIKGHPSEGVKILFMMIYTLLRKLKEANRELAYERREDGCQDEVDALIGSLLPGDSDQETAEDIFSKA